MDTQIRTAKRSRLPRPTSSGIRRRFVFHPLAVALVILLGLPVLSWQVQSKEGGGPFQASAQGASPVCPPNPSNLIIQNTCPAGVLIDTNGDLKQLESDAVNAYLGLHELPATDASVIYTYGREDLRDAIRAAMIVQMLAIIKKPASQRTQHEKTLYMWLQRLVQQNEVALYTKAIAEAQRFFNSPCLFTLDSDIASAYNLRYNGQPFCAGTVSAVFPPPIPAVSYFTAYGFKNSYAAAAQTFPDFGSLMADTSISEGEQAGISLAAGGVVAAAAAAALFANLSAALSAFSSATTVTIEGTSALAASSSFLLSGSTVSAVGLGTLVAGPASIILVAIAVGVQAVIEIIQNNQNLADINNLSNLLSQAENNPPDLAAMAADTSGLGLYKIETTMNSQTVPDRASSTSLPKPQPGSDLNFAITSPGGVPQTFSLLRYVDWDGNNWTAQSWGGWFVETCSTVTQSAKCLVRDSINANIRYLDVAGVKWTASRIGNNFVNTKANPSPTDSICPADTLTGVTPVTTNLSKCSSYVSDQLSLQYSADNPVTAKLSVLRPPVVSGSTSLAFGPGIPSTQTITVSGNPAPTVCLSSGSLTADFSLNGGQNCGTGTFQIQFNGNLNAATADYFLTLTATNSAGHISIPVAIHVSPQLAIISPSSLSGTAGVPVTFKVVATGVPTPKLSTTLNLNLQGLKFTDNGNGTATISGVVDIPVASICINPCGIQATNSNGTIVQNFSLNFSKSSPVATLIPPDSANFYTGTTNVQQLGSAGAITPVSWSLSQSTNPPSWLSLQDNGNGTAVLRGTPPVGASGTSTFDIITKAVGAFGYINVFTINVVNKPVFLSRNTAVFTVGSLDSFDISTTQGTVSLVGDLPTGLTFLSGAPSTITGTPAVRTGGQYTVDLVDDAGTEEKTTQSLTINVKEAPTITSAPAANFYAGEDNTFAVTVSGFPALSSAPVSQRKAVANYVAGMAFEVRLLPADLTYSNLNQAGYNTGTLILSGTPSSADVGRHVVTIYANNGVGVHAIQQLTLNIGGMPGDANGDRVTNCADFDFVKASFGKYRDQPGYNSAADLNNDGVVNIEDLDIVATHISQGTVCQ